MLGHMSFKIDKIVWTYPLPYLKYKNFFQDPDFIKVSLTGTGGRVRPRRPGGFPPWRVLAYLVLLLLILAL